jgi:hypothetical protein
MIQEGYGAAVLFAIDESAPAGMLQALRTVLADELQARDVELGRRRRVDGAAVRIRYRRGRDPGCLPAGWRPGSRAGILDAAADHRVSRC